MTLVGQSELHHRIEIEIDDSRLVHVARIRRLDVSGEEIVEQRARPIEVRPQTSWRRVILGEERHVGNGAGEDAPVRALRGNYRRIAGVSAPVGSRRRLTRAENLLQRAGEPSIVDRSADQSRVRSVLKESDSAAHYRARTAHRTGESGDLRRRAV